MSNIFGIIGIIIIIFVSYLLSNNRKKISLKTVLRAFILQVLLAVFILKVPIGIKLFDTIGKFIQKILDFAQAGADFVFGPLTGNPEKFVQIFGDGAHIFSLKLLYSIIFLMVLVNILYYYGIMQRVVAILGKAMNKLLKVSGAEALSNVASPFVGQIVAQIMIKPYLAKLTPSELLASMSGSLACISAGVMAIYVGMGIPAQYLLAASIMAAPGALVISKIIYPEDCQPETMENIHISNDKDSFNVIDSIAKGAIEGMKVALNVIAILLALVALITMIDWFLNKFGIFLQSFFHISNILGINLDSLSMKSIVGKIFSIFALLLGVPFQDISSVGALLGEKLILNETIAYIDLISLKNIITEKSFIISSFALCGFANLGSVAILVGGISELAPCQRENLSKLAFKALISGTFASYISAAIAGILI